ncbi:MAG: Methyltransferase domain [Thermoleophilaceae bacterium]|nr:Methyltransferase domain [Thermoleophilaceae bacterium]
MSRVAYRYVLDGTHPAGYSGALPETREQFEAHLRQRWIAELHTALTSVLSPDRRVLSIGAGMGEHELLLQRRGFDVVASDVDPTVLEPATKLYPELKTAVIDILESAGDGSYDDVLVTGLDYALDDAQLRAAFQNAKTFLTGDGRVIFVHRFNDNFATRLIDVLLAPTAARLQNWRATRSGATAPLQRVRHGIRRSRREIIELAAAEGWRPRSRTYAGFGVELDRIALEVHVPRLYRAVGRADRRLHVLTLATVFEFSQ